MKSMTATEILVIICTAMSLIGFAVFPAMESATYNKLTGAKTTWWDAVWVELRIQDKPLSTGNQ